MNHQVGVPLLQALVAYVKEDYNTCCDLLLPTRVQASIFGGSHAQRDLITLTLLAAANRSNRKGLVKALHNERQLQRASDLIGVRVSRAAA